MRIVCIIQIYNELETGHLVAFFEENALLFDDIIIYDDGSTDGSAELCKKYTSHIISSRNNEFKKELQHKSRMLEMATELDADFIVSLDADEILSITRSELEKRCEDFNSKGFDGLTVEFINLWRSRNYKRIDSLFDEMLPVKVWKHKADLVAYSSVKDELHQKLYPDYVINVTHDESVKIIHTGFSTEERVLRKYLRYKSIGQRGFNLSRFIDESNLKMEKVPDHFFPSGWECLGDEPKAQSMYHYVKQSIIAREKNPGVKVSIICLIYQDVNWLDFLYEQVLKYTELKDCEFYFIANQPTEDVINYLSENYIPHYIFEPEEVHKNEHYINNVYRAYNYGVSKAKGDYVVLINSDMAFTEGWLDNLIKHHDGTNCISSRLVESGRLRTGKYGIEKNFGYTYADYKEDDFQQFSELIKLENIKDGGLYMPLFVRKDHFDMVGGYPAGNITKDSDVFNPEIAVVGAPLISGDTAFILKLSSFGIKHSTAFDSVVYHFQEGEKSSGENAPSFHESKTKIVVCNDILTGTMGEKVLWDFLLTLPNVIGLDYKKVGGRKSFSFIDYMQSNQISPSIIVQNISFMDHIDAPCFKVGFIQDDLRLMNAVSFQQESNLKRSDLLVTNSYYTASSYPEYDFSVASVGVDSELFRVMDQAEVRKEFNIPSYDEIGVFVGALDDVKGWPKVLAVLEKRPNMYLIVVSKYQADFEHERASLFCMLDQQTLAKVLNCADFFILGSKVETQCLAAIEAALCDLPIIMNRTGIFVDIHDEDLNSIGRFGSDFDVAIQELSENKFSPRETIMKYPITINESMNKWKSIFTQAKFENDKVLYRSNSPVNLKEDLQTNIKLRVEYIYRRKVLYRIIGRDNFFTVSEISIYLKSKLPKSLFSILRSIWKKINKT